MVVKVTSQCGEFLGRTSFRYVDEMLEMQKQLVQDPAEQSLLFSCMLQEYGSIGTDSDSAQVLVPPNLQFQGKWFLVFMAYGISSVFNPKVCTIVAD